MEPNNRETTGRSTITGRAFPKMGWAFRFGVTVIGAIACCDTSLGATRLRYSEVPQPLQAWVPWVLHDHETIACPAAYNDPNRHDCVWPSRLALALTATGGTFTAEVDVFAPDAVVQLPGQSESWPQNVTANGRPVAVTESDGRPVLRLAPGHFSVGGAFSWREPPPSIAVPSDAGLLTATYESRVLGWPDANGQLWVKRQALKTVEADTLTVRVFRRLDDEIPLKLTTDFEISASGRPREVRLAAGLLPGFVPLGISSPLPARVQPDGSIRLQLRAGTWTVEIEGRSRDPVTSLSNAAGQDEIWGFAARNDLRIVAVEAGGGAAGVDPRQFGVPDAWQGLPAFRMPPGGSLKFVERRRGDPDPQADKLGLNRTLWLDFGGGGFTAHDQIRGTISRSWRLDTTTGLELGRVSSGGEEQFITRLSGTGANADRGMGVEVRQGTAQIDADSRLPASRTLPVTGWKADFDRVSVELRLPPGWRLLHASGTDTASGSWVARWTLWDFFFVFLLVAASYRLHGAAAAGALGAALVLTWHLPGSPSWLWMLLLLLSALINAARAIAGDRVQRARGWLRLGWRATLAAIVLTLLPFAASEVRSAIFPVLEPGQTAVTFEVGSAGARREVMDSLSTRQVAAPALLARKIAPVGAPHAVTRMPGEEESEAANAPTVSESKDMHALPQAPAPAPEGELAGVSSLGSRVSSLQSQNFLQQDPNAKIQTGPGLPAWHWHSYSLGWSGPVERSQQVTLWLQPPWMTRLLVLAELLLLLAAAYLHARVPADPAGGAPGARPSPSGGDGPAAAQLASLMLAATMVALLCCPRAAIANEAGDSPSDARLAELRERLQRPAACQPSCANVAKLMLALTGSSLRMSLEVHAGADVFLPLPVGGNWHPLDVRIDGQRAELKREGFGDGALMVRVAEGVHQVSLESELGAIDQIQIALPLTPKRVDVRAPDWSVGGLDERGMASGAISLTRTKTSGSGAAATDDTSDGGPPFVRVVRTLQLSQVWTVYTEIVRVNRVATPLVVKVPLLDAEAVTDPAVRVDGKVALVTLGSGQNATFSSTLRTQPHLQLRAATEPNQIETWRLDVAPMWHAAFQGIAPVQRQEGNRWLPQWQPWPGEAVTIDIVQPEGVAGSTLTIDRIDVASTPGKRATDVRAEAVIRSSQGGNHIIRLPEGAELRSVRIDGQMQPIRAEGRNVVLPVVPGTRTAVLEWREPRGVEALFRGARADFGAHAVNLHASIAVPSDRWILFVGGPVLGPAVLFWGVAVVVAAAALLLARLHWTPLAFTEWLLLGLGLAQASLGGAVFVAAVLLAFAARDRYADRLQGWRFNLMQIVLALGAILALIILFDAVRTGLLGTPEMRIVGNGSSARDLHWYLDRNEGLSVVPWVLSLPMWMYRVFMLAWGLWLALAVLRYARWTWSCFSKERIWTGWARRASSVA